MRLCPGQNRLFAVPREPVGRVSPGRHALLKLMPLYATHFGSMIGSCRCPPWNRPTSESIETSSCSPSPAAQRTATEPASALSARCGHARSLASRCRRLRSASFHPGPGEAGTRGTTRRTRRRAGAWRRSGIVVLRSHSCFKDRKKRLWRAGHNVLHASNPLHQKFARLTANAPRGEVGTARRHKLYRYPRGMA
jgi:hypothetical protein